jgi:hypothetical protein
MTKVVGSSNPNVRASHRIEIEERVEHDVQKCELGGSSPRHRVEAAGIGRVGPAQDAAAARLRLRRRRARQQRGAAKRRGTCEQVPAVHAAGGLWAHG